MIKILKHGTQHVITCYNCSCKFSYEEEDILEDALIHCAIFMVTRYVICPDCERNLPIIMSKGE